MKEITNIHVDSYEPFSKRAAAGWEMDGARFHFWFNTETKEIERQYGSRDRRTIYKNPPFGMDRNDPAFFDTRYLDAGAGSNVAIVGHVFESIEREGLIAKAIAAFEAGERKRKAETEEYRRQERVKAAAPKLVEALRAVLADHRRISKVDGTSHCKAVDLLRSLGEEV